MSKRLATVRQTDTCNGSVHRLARTLPAPHTAIYCTYHLSGVLTMLAMCREVIDIQTTDGSIYDCQWRTL